MPTQHSVSNCLANMSASYSCAAGSTYTCLFHLSSPLFDRLNSLTFLTRSTIQPLTLPHDLDVNRITVNADASVVIHRVLILEDLFSLLRSIYMGRYIYFSLFYLGSLSICFVISLALLLDIPHFLQEFFWALQKFWLCHVYTCIDTRGGVNMHVYMHKIRYRWK